MNRSISILILMILGMAECYARSEFFNHTELDLYDGICMPVNRSSGGTVRAGYSAIIIFRYTFRESPWDCGIYVQSDFARRRYPVTGKQTNATTIFGTMASFNFNRGHKFNPFVSLGVGACCNRVKGNDDIRFNRWGVACTPMAGIAMWKWLRISAYFQLSRRDFTTAGLTLGLTI